jgi:flagellar motor switch protein FliN/FliY
LSKKDNNISDTKDKKTEFKGMGDPENTDTLENIKKVGYPTFKNTGTNKSGNSIEILMDIPMKVVVELGRATLTIKDILELGPGSIVELDKLSGEPVDIIVNGKLMAKGEVVVIDENFGIRISNVVIEKN